MTQAGGETEDARLTALLAVLLERGTWLACAMVGAGLVAQWLGGSATVGLRLVTIGLALFLALPVARLAMLLVTFVRRRDIAFALVVTLVLAIIAVAFAVGALLPVGVGKPG